MSKQKQSKFSLRFEKGMIVPADGYTASQIREAGYRVGDVVLATFSKLRNPKYNRLAHAFGRMVADNIDGFEGLDAHSVLKRIQFEANIACDQMAANLPCIGPVEVRIPRSLSFAAMDQDEFEGVYSAMCRYVAERYWHGLTEQQIAEMVEAMPND